MRVWVDCTAAAHPLVLRPIIERLEARGHEVFVTAREYGQTLGILERLGIPYTAVGQPRRRLGARQGRGAGEALGAAGAARLAAPRPTWRSRTARSTSPSSRLCSAFPRPRCRTTSSPACSASISFRVARRVLVPDAIPLERLRRIGAKERTSWSATRASRRSTTWPTSSPTRRCSTSSGSTARRSSWSCGRRRRPPSTTRQATSTVESIQPAGQVPLRSRRSSSPAPSARR